MDQDTKVKDLLYVDFDLPFVLFLRDSLDDLDLRAWLEAARSGDPNPPYSKYAPHPNQPIATVIGGGIPVFTPPTLADPYEVQVDGLHAAVRLLRRVNISRDPIVIGELPGDRVGRVSFSSARVLLLAEQLTQEQLGDPRKICEIALDVINHLIDHYRVVAKRPYVGRVTPSVIQEFVITTTYKNADDHDTLRYGAGSGALRGFGGALDELSEQELRDVIFNPTPPPIFKTLELNILDCLDLRDWRLALIELAVLFEAWVSGFVRDKFRGVGLPDADIDKKFLNSKGLPLSVTAIARDLVKEATLFDFSATAEFANWATAVRDKRNLLIHGKRFDVSEQEALSAQQAVVAAITLLKTK